MTHTKEQLDLWDAKVKRATSRTSKGLGPKRGLHQHFPRIKKTKHQRPSLPRRVRRKYSTLARRKLRNKIIRCSNITRYVTVIKPIRPPPLHFLVSDDSSLISYGEMPKDMILRYHPP